MNEQNEIIICDHWVKAHKLCLDLNDTLILISSSHSVVEILHRVLEASRKALGTESARIAMREGDHWIIRDVSNLPDDLIGRSFTDNELRHAALAMTTRKPVAIDDAFHDDRTNTEMMKSLGIRSVMVIPLIQKDVVIGTVLYGYHSRTVSFTEPEIDYAERLASAVNLAVEHARLHQELEESAKLSEALLQIDNILYSAHDHITVMNDVLQVATDAIGAESGVIFSKEDDKWRVWYGYKMPLSLIGQTFSNTEVMHTAITVKTRRSFVAQDVLNDPAIDQKFVEMFGIRSLLDFPLIVQGEVIGDLTFHYHSKSIPFNERQVEFARKLQSTITLALENIQLINTAKQSESQLKEAETLGKSGYFHYDIATKKDNVV